MLRKAKGREFITEAPFRLLARCSEMPVVPSNFLQMRVYWSIWKSRAPSTLLPYGTYTIFCHKCDKRVQLIMQPEFSSCIFQTSSSSKCKKLLKAACCMLYSYLVSPICPLTNKIRTKTERYSNLCCSSEKAGDTNNFFYFPNLPAILFLLTFHLLESHCMLRW